jgi:hypothetical protein
VTQPDIDITGTFQNKRGVVGGELKTLAYLLHNVTIEVDMTDVTNPHALDASRLRLNGHFEVFEAVESEPRWRFKAHQATRIGKIGE